MRSVEFPALAGMIRHRKTPEIRGFEFPALAGMIRSANGHAARDPRVPRARGDDPVSRRGCPVVARSSPRSRG